MAAMALSDIALPLIGARHYTAVEFFSGIGSFSEAVRRTNIRVTAAFDQSAHANVVFDANFSTRANSRNLDTVKLSDIPPADIWWLSPPCTPYSVRGNRRDDEDSRARSLKNLLQLIQSCSDAGDEQSLPGIVFVENVEGFVHSRMHERLLRVLSGASYEMRENSVCPTELAVPMLRPRFFITAVRKPFVLKEWLIKPQPGVPLKQFLDKDYLPILLLSPVMVERYGETFDVVDCEKPDARAICFTSGYGKSARSSGSYIKLPEGSLRRFSPREILRLLGYRDEFRLPDTLPLNVCWRLVGNAVDLRSIRLLLESVQDASCSAKDDLTTDATDNSC